MAEPNPFEELVAELTALLESSDDMAPFQLRSKADLRIVLMKLGEVTGRLELAVADNARLRGLIAEKETERDEINGSARFFCPWCDRLRKSSGDHFTGEPEHEPDCKAFGGPGVVR